MDLLEEVIALARRADVSEADIKALGLTWRWYTKVRDGLIPNPGIRNVLALKQLSERKLAKRRAA